MVCYPSGGAAKDVLYKYTEIYLSCCVQGTFSTLVHRLSGLT